jgi:thiamine-monophosphate kinase
MKGDGPTALRDAYRRPVPRLTEGRALGPVVHAMMDVSDGLLIDARCAWRARAGWRWRSTSTRFRSPPRHAAMAARIAPPGWPRRPQATITNSSSPCPRHPAPVAATRVGQFDPGEGLRLFDASGPVPLPARLGFQHDTAR